MDTRGYVAGKEWEYRIRRDEIEVEICPLCGCDKFHFHINADTGQYRCLKCNEAGNLWSLKKKLGDLNIKEPMGESVKKPKVDIERLTADLLKSNEAKRFLKDRKLGNKKIVEHFKVGFDKGRKAIAIPYFEGRKLVNVKYRSITGKNFEKEPGCRSTLFNIDGINGSCPLIVVEGEFDAMAAWAMGYENVVSLPDGAASVKAVSAIESTACEILIATDNDDDGERAAENIARMLGGYRCKRLRLPYKDFNDCLINGMRPEGIQSLIETAAPIIRHDLLNGSELHERLVRKLSVTSKPGMMTGWKEFDAILGGLRSGELTIVTGDTGIGKTTWTLNVAYKLMAQGVPVLIVSAEMRPEKLLGKLYSIHTGKYFNTYRDNSLQFLYPEKIFGDADMSECKRYFSDKPILMWGGSGDLPLWKLIDLINYSAFAYGVRFVLLDHLHFFIEVNNPEYERNAIEKFTRGIARAAVETDTHVMLICHPSKEIGVEGRVYLNHLKGSASIKQDASNVIALYRDRASLATDTEVWIQKCRDDTGREGKIVFKFDETNQRYTSTARERL